MITEYGCCISLQGLNHDRIRSEIVRQSKGETSRYHGTTERGRCQSLGNVELVLTEDGIYSQVIGLICSNDRGFLHIPLGAITNVREQSWFNGLYRIDRPHLVVTYMIPGKGEFQVGWQMNQIGYEQWGKAIETLLEQKLMTQSD